jgi:hypothetical protein
MISEKAVSLQSLAGSSEAIVRRGLLGLASAQPPSPFAEFDLRLL